MARRSARVAPVVGLVLAALLILVDLRGGAPARALRAATGAVAGPPIEALAWLRGQAGQRFGGAAEERARIEVLEQELARSRAQAAAAAAGLLAEAEQRALANGLPEQGYRWVAARRVAASPPQDLVRAIAVSAGSRDGVAPGQAVMAVDGLAGLVDSASPGVSTVRLLVDPSMALAARVTPSGEVGVLRGTGRAASFELLDPVGRMAAGDLIVTIGTADGVLPADLPVGRVSAVRGSAADLSRVAAVQPGVDASTLDRVVVLVPEGGP
jgi:rod shape-determining protein MreC